VSRVLALYLPQYHPVPENDAWWGKGFTEWTNVVRAEPQFRGHYQPHLPSELGFYDLRTPETRIAQAELAREHGISGFCYYHYWFNGKLLLERPLREVLDTGKPDFPFCMCWANENWTRTWSGGADQVLMQQRYTADDHVEHLRWLAPYFRDPRYIKVHGKPVFLVYRAGQIDQVRRATDIWREEAHRLGFPGLYLIRFESIHAGEQGIDPAEWGFDAAAEFQPRSSNSGAVKPRWLRGRFRALAPSAYRRHRIRDYARLVAGALARKPVDYKRFPCVTPGWDNSARRTQQAASIWVGSTPDLYERWLREVLLRFKPFGDQEDFVFINAWNEWAEGNHLEPDQKWGRGYLEATRRAVTVASR
jgi:lipopolysaccharide biosynthesis protein